MTARTLPNNRIPNKQEPLYGISGAAKLLGVSPSTLRRWETEGRLVPIRTSGGNHRRYSQDNVKRLLKSFRRDTDSRRINDVKPQIEIPEYPLGTSGRLPPKIPVRTLEQTRQPFRRRKRVPHRLVDVTLLLISLALLYSVVTPLTQERLYQAFANPLQNLIHSTVKIVSPQKAELIKPGILNPIVDVNDAFEYVTITQTDAEQNTETRGLRAKLTLIGSEIITQTLRVVKNGVFNTTQLLGTIFFGEGKRYFINRLGDATLRAATFFERVAIKTGITTGTALKISFEKATQTGDLTGVEVDFSKITDPPSTLTRYGIHLKDSSEPTATDYGVYVEGTNWDYGIYSEDDLYVGGTLTVGDDATISGNLLPGIDSTFDIGAIGIEWANLYVDDITAGTVSSGDTTLSSLTVTDQTDLQGDVLDTTGNLTLNDTIDISGALNVTGATTLSSTLDVSGNTTVGGDLSVTGSVSGGAADFSSLMVTGTSDLRGDVLDTTGNLTLNDSVDVSGDLTVSGGDIDGPLSSITMADGGWVGIGSAAERILFDGTGDDIEIMGANVGIGTTSPSTLLEIEDGALTLSRSGSTWGEQVLSSSFNAHWGEDTLTFENTEPTSSAAMELRHSATSEILFTHGSGVGEMDWVIESLASSGNLEFSDTSWNYALVLEQGGSVGIGRTNPDFTLDVAGDIRITSANKLYFGGVGATGNDVNLYRSAADTLKTDDSLSVGENIYLRTDKYLYLGSAQQAWIRYNNGYINLEPGVAGIVSAFHESAEAGSTNNGVHIYNYIPGVGGARSGRIYLASTGIFQLDPGISTRLALDYSAEDYLTTFENSTSGKNREFRIYGFNSTTVQAEYGLLQYDDADDRFRIDVSTGDLELDDDVFITGNLTVQGPGNNTFTGHILPSGDNQYDLGSATYRWRDLYLGPASLNISDTTGTSGAGSDYVNATLGFSGEQLQLLTSLEGIQSTGGNILIQSAYPSGGTTTEAIRLATAGAINDSDELLQIGEGSTDFLTILGSGYVGIGTTGPGRKLSVAGSINTNYTGIYIGGTEGDDAYRIYADASSMKYTGGYHRFYVGGGTEALTLENTTGNVGIGTMGPSSRLSVKAGSAGVTTLDLVDSAGGVFGELADGSGSGSGGLVIRGLRDAGQGGQGLQLIGRLDPIANTNYGVRVNVTDAAGTGGIANGALFGVQENGTEMFRVHHDGNVGIGETGPGYRLSILGADAASPALSISGSTFGGNIGDYTGFVFGGEQDSTYKKGGIFFVSDEAGGYLRGSLQFAINSAASSANAAPSDTKMTIDRNGDVGIGTTDPGKKLDVSGAIRSTSTIHVYDGASWQSYLDQSGATAIYHNGWGNVTLEAGGSVVFKTWTDPAYTAKMTITNAGLVNIPGLGASADVQTDASKNLTTASDMNWKNDLGLIENGIDIVNQLKPHYFIWKRDASGNAVPNSQPRLAGFFAQEVYEVFPEGSPGGANIDEDGEEHWGLNSRAIMAVLTKAIQEQQTQIEELKSMTLVDAEGDLAKEFTVDSQQFTEKILAGEIEAETGIFQRLTVMIEAIFEKITAKTAEIAEAVIQTLRVEKAEIKTLEVEALSTGESSDTAGSGVVKEGEGSVTIESLAVTERSKIYVTFTTDYAPATRFWIAEKKAGESFTVELDAPVTTDAKFDWWIVN